MIDHISIAVRDLEAGGRFYEALLATLGYTKLITRPTTIGFGKKYPDFWINVRPKMATPDPDGGVHICLRAPSAEAVDAFHAAALKMGGRTDGSPGPRPEYTPGYYAAFVLDPDGNRIEAVTFLDAGR
jgi:catechol 2,3-dioxygenase-like lactoylglutathione lyase family enzyme